VRSASAFAAMTVIVLGTPAIAMAGPLSPGSGPGGGPGQVRIACPLPPGQHVAPRPVRVRVQGRRHPVRLFCPPRPLVFDVAPGGSTLTEVSGPVLAPPEEFRYPAITRAIVVIACTPRTVR
jgi:hypothetical protein